MSRGLLVVLNGTSSSGKTSTARALQDLAAEAFILTGLDHFWGQMPRRYFEEKSVRSDGIRSIYRGEGPDRRTVGWEIGPTFRKLMYGLHRAVRVLVEVGNNVVVDYVVFERDLLLDAAGCWAELDGVFVGMKPPLEVSEAWERKRGDRDLGQARCAFEATHAHDTYDLVIDPSGSTPEESARRLLEHIRAGNRPRAFRQLDGSSL